MVGNLLAQTVQGTMYYFDNYGPMWYTLDFPSVIHLPPGAYWLVEVHNASGQIMVGSDVIDGYESVDSFISGMTFHASLPSPVTFSNYVFCIYASWAVNISASLSLENTDFSIVSNSTISPLVYNSSTNEVNFNVSGLIGTVGYTEAFISKTMLPNITEASLALDGKQHNFMATSLGDSWLLHFVYPHNTHNVAIRLEGNPIPEFSTPNLAVLFLFAIISLATAIFLRKRRRLRSFVDLGFTK